MKAIAALVKIRSDGKLPSNHARVWCASSLTPLRKKDGGVRPIAAGDCLRRLVGKCILASGIAKAQVSALQPVQVGVGAPAAAEAVALAVASLTRKYRDTGNWVLLKVDLKNAFN